MQNLISTSSNSSDSLSYDLQAWQKGYLSQPNEYDYWIDDIEGEIPPELEGTLYRNGPGLLDINGQAFRHPFDGDGMISAIRFTNGRAHYCNRFVRTQGYVEEQKAGKILYRGVFGTQKPGGWLANFMDLRIKNIANTQVIYWAGKLLALWEAAQPYRLDPHTLETLGIDDLDGILEPGDGFAAHVRIDPNCEENGGEPCLVNFSIKPRLSTLITIYEISTQGKLLKKQVHSVPGFAFIHDFAMTPNYCIFFQNPVKFNPIPYLLGFSGAGECVKFEPKEPTKIIGIPRNSSKIKYFETSSGFVFHHANAYEDRDRIIVDSICYESLPEVRPNDDYRETDFSRLNPGQLWRFSLDLTTGNVEKNRIESRCCEFPALHPNLMGRPYRYLYLGAAHSPQGNAPLQAILKLDLNTNQRQLWSAAPEGFVSEPVFVPRQNAIAEDDGWLLTVVYDSHHHRSDIVILDGRDLTQGVIARLHLKHHIPYGLHGTFVTP
ncbi:Apocarotenoid-15,15'-oxygenase [Planktothrix tepida]|uniref:Apocarotenoid-15,15'-oxygenase n=1 Tax=Planktothrix tepida PCC 9214 TaxID=671072 RepID=A0A1J1LG01_9CYAN|nr:carotenoid oxygenase family protein [Planktothrix tepida]CAD5929359.1 Apocarotenoid-15,15'-oxygenase [Planktothrix tepida]CUR31475.1 Apocarotenoid-15,15'-oxygenase [Planktothrix tepida PCC 9214]